MQYSQLNLQNSGDWMSVRVLNLQFERNIRSEQLTDIGNQLQRDFNLLSTTQQSDLHIEILILGYWVKNDDLVKSLLNKGIVSNITNKLKKVYLRRVAEIPSDLLASFFSQLLSVQHLQILNCEDVQTLQPLSSLHNLKSLWIFNTLLQQFQDLGKNLGNIQNLQELSLNISNGTPAEYLQFFIGLQNSKQLKHLRLTLGNVFFTEGIDREDKRLKILEETEEFISAGRYLGQMRSLETIHLNIYQDFEQLPAFLENALSSPNLQKVVFTNNQLVQNIINKTIKAVASCHTRDLTCKFNFINNPQLEEINQKWFLELAKNSNLYILKLEIPRSFRKDEFRMKMIRLCPSLVKVNIFSQH